MTPSILLRNGTLLLHTPSTDAVAPTKSDLLIEGSIITNIAPYIAAPPGAEIIDCTNKIISPGFIDTHRHMWQTQLKGRHANHVLHEYMFTGGVGAAHYEPEDLFWGNLTGALEGIDAGTTMVVDHSHCSYSTASADNALAGTIASGIRSVYCYVPGMFRVTEWEPLMIDLVDPMPAWALKQLADYAESQPWAEGRVTLGLGHDMYFLPAPMTADLITSARSLGIRLITSHDFRGPIAMESVEPLHAAGLLGPDFLISHETQPTAPVISALLSSGSHVSSTPGSELQMQHGDPIAFHPDLSAIASFGIDCHSSCSASIPETMRVALQYARGKQNQRLLDDGNQLAPTVSVQALDAFNLGTIKGARAVRMETEIGSLMVGKKADVVVFDALSPAMLGAAQHDPVAAVVIHSSVRDVEYVIVDGVVRKREGRLVDVDVGSEKGGVVGWDTVARKTVESRERIQKKAGAVNMEKVRESPIVKQLFSPK